MTTIRSPRASIHTPKPGYYKMSRARKGVLVPVWVFEEGERCPETGEPLEDIKAFVEINEHLIDEANARFMKEIERVNLFGEQITEKEYRYLCARRKWAEKFSPEDPAARPHEAVDFNKMEPLF